MDCVARITIPLAINLRMDVRSETQLAHRKSRDDRIATGGATLLAYRPRGLSCSLHEVDERVQQPLQLSIQQGPFRRASRRHRSRDGPQGGQHMSRRRHAVSGQGDLASVDVYRHGCVLVGIRADAQPHPRRDGEDEADAGHEQAAAQHDVVQIHLGPGDVVPFPLLVEGTHEPLTRFRVGEVSAGTTFGHERLILRDLPCADKGVPRTKDEERHPEYEESAFVPV